MNHEHLNLLMCRPDFYGVEYEINPWMDRERDCDRAAARRQWDALCGILTQRMGVEVALVTPVDGLPDMVFTANGGFVDGKRFMSANFRYRQRKAEEQYFVQWFQSAGYEIHEPPSETLFEGEGDILRSGRTLFAGYRFRSDIRSHAWISEITGCEVLSLELTDPRFYHLDTCFCPLPGGEIIYYPAAFDSYAVSVINDYFAESRRIEISHGEAVRFGCNAIACNNMVVTNSGCKVLADDLEERGYTVFQTELSEFLKAGGSAKCLSLIIDKGL